MKNPNKNRYIMFIVIMIGIPVAGISGIVYGVEPIHLFFIIGSLISCSGLIYGILTVRCPHCHKSLHLKGLLPDNCCPHCREKIN